MRTITHLIARGLSLCLPGSRLHQAGLEALHRRLYRSAGVCFEAAAQAYRRDLEVQALARVRIHQRMALVMSGLEPDLEAQRCLEVERALCLIEELESLEPPFERRDARRFIAHWMAATASRDGARDPQLDVA